MRDRGRGGARQAAAAGEDVVSTPRAARSTRARARRDRLRRACRVGAGAVLVPGVEVGEEAFIAAGAVVTSDVAPRAVVMGVPARAVREVGDADLLERWR